MIDVTLRHKQGDFTLDICATAPSEGVTALIGPSGCGKSTLAHLMAGLLTPARGRLVVNDTVFFDSDRGINLPIERRGIGFLFQTHRLFPHLSVEENLDFGVKWGGRKPVLSKAELIDILGIGHLLARKPASLSGGESQRVALGRALQASERLLILDEPLSSLDEERKAELIAYLERVFDHLCIPVWLITHSTLEAQRLARYTWRLRDGFLIDKGPTP